LIKHMILNEYIAVGDYGERGRLYMKMKDIGSEFIFWHNSDDTCMVLLADLDHYNLNPEGSTSHNGTRIILWPHNIGNDSKWQIRIENNIKS